MIFINKKTFVSLFLILYLGLSGFTAKAQSDLQCRIAILQYGKTSVEEIKMLFGEPVSQTKLTDWVETSYSISKKDYILVGTKAAERYKSNYFRTLYDYNYPNHGLIFTLFDNPSELNSLEITNPQISVSGIKVGDKLGKVKRILGKNDNWYTSNGRADWTLDYEKQGVKFYFAADKNAPQYPMKLDKSKRIIKIEKYDNSVSFTG